MKKLCCRKSVDVGVGTKETAIHKHSSGSQEFCGLIHHTSDSDG